MQIRRILLRNLHSIRDEVEIDFTTNPLAETGLFAITGDTGAGKTTILDAITLALYGNICRNSDPRDTLSYGADEGFAECEFEAGGRRFLAQWRVRTTRSKKPENRLKAERAVAEWDPKTEEFHIIAERRKKEIESFIEEVTGLDFPRFTRSVLLAQGDFAAFLKANPKERSDLLERITGTEIYSELSKAALERKNIEQAKLHELTRQRDTLHIFSKEILREKKKELKTREKENKTLQQELQDAKQQLQWLHQIELYSTRKAAALKALDNLNRQRSSLQSEFDKLELHKKTLPLHPTLARYQDKLSALENLRTETGELEKSLEQQELQETGLKENYESEKSTFAELKKSQPAAIRLYEEVGRLDTMIDNREATCEKLRKDREEWKEKLEISKQRKASLDRQTTELGSTIKELDDWLRDHRDWVNLPIDLPSIQLLRGQLRELLVNERDVKQSIGSLDKELTAAKKRTDQLEKELSEERSSLKKNLEAFGQLTPTDYVSNRAELIERINREIESLGDKYKHFRQLSSLSEEYRRSLTEFSELEEQLHNLRREELALDKELLSAVEVSDEAEKHLNFKREIFRQQMLIANYEKDRATLEEGQPCPLCFSTHHPFREKETKPYVDQAKDELIKAESTFNRMQERRNQLLKRHVEVASQIQQIDSRGNGHLGKIRARLEDYESKMAALFPNMGYDDFARSHGDWLMNKLAGFDQTLQQKKENREQLSTMHRNITKMEERIRQLESELKDSHFKVLQLNEKRGHQSELLQSIEAKFKQGTDDINALVKKYGFLFSIEEANAMFTELESREKEYSAKKERREALKQQLDLNKQELEQVGTAIVENEKKFKAVNSETDQEATALEELKNKRVSLFGKKDPQTEREDLLAQVDQKEVSLNEIRSRYEELKASLTSHRQSLKDLQNRLTRESRSLETIQQKLEKGLQKADFATVEELEAAILAEEDSERIEAENNQLRQKEIELNQSLRSTEEELTTLQKKQLTDRDAKEIKSEIETTETQIQTLQQAMGALKQQLQDNEARKEEAQKLLELIEDQRKDYNRWMALYDLIGSSDGKKFRIFAQGLTLQKLVQLANSHLANLYGRYIVVKRPGEDLELDIVDTYQAENTRSMHTLSGGESFLVSLALALGLSDLAGRKANIKSLFIDEGFGTLDDQTLDLAIRTLENLQASGKTIGIISHVKELKERITTQVRVTKKGGGVSQVEVIG